MVCFINIFPEKSYSRESWFFHASSSRRALTVGFRTGAAANPMSTASRRAPQNATPTVPMLMGEWQLLQDALAWLERLRALLEGCGGWTAEDQRRLGELARDLLRVAVSGFEGPPVVMVPHPVPAPKASRNSHRAPALKRWSLNERLRELGYPEEVSRSKRIKLGQAVVDAYRQAHGKAPAMADPGRRPHATRVSLYDEADLPLVDGVIRAMLGEPSALTGAVD